MSDLHSKLHDYVESTIERIDAEDVVAAVSAGSTADPRPKPRLRPVWIAAGAALLVALLVGVPLLLLRGGDSTIAEQPATTTTPAATTIPATTQPASTSTVPPTTATAVPGVPLGETVPGFTDTIVMFTTERAHHVLRWDPSEPTPHIVLTAGGSPVGLDVSAGWLAEIVSDGDLLLYPVPTAPGGSATPAVVASDVDSAIWHDTEAGQLVYLACPEPASGTATLFTLDITDPAAEPTLVRAFDQGCVGDVFFDGWQVGDVWLGSWGSDGVAVGVFDGATFGSVLIGADGIEIPGDPEAAMVPEGPNGEYLDAAKIVASDETLRHAWWSPNGAHLALLIAVPNPDGPPGRILRIVDAATGTNLVDNPDLDVNLITGSLVWSSNSRFVVYHSWQQPTDLAEGLYEDTGSASLGFYDTATNTITMVPLDGFVDEIRIP